MTLAEIAKARRDKPERPPEGSEERLRYGDSIAWEGRGYDWWTVTAIYTFTDEVELERQGGKIKKQARLSTVEAGIRDGRISIMESGPPEDPRWGNREHEPHRAAPTAAHDD